MTYNEKRQLALLTDKGLIHSHSGEQGKQSIKIRLAGSRYNVTEEKSLFFVFSFTNKRHLTLTGNEGLS